MGIFIKGIGIISPQKTFDSAFLNGEIVPFSGNRLSCYEPDYSTFIDAKKIRRMSKVLKMGVVSAMLALKDAQTEKPEAVIVGTALGCLEDTASFLKKMVQNKEEMLNPTAFIHSTHNTIAAQVAMMFECQGYNSTYVHRNISFESALIDAMMLLNEGTVKNVLTGAIDELTDTSLAILDRLGNYKRTEELAEGQLYAHATKGSIGGEGSAFFMLSGEPGAGSYAAIKEVATVSFSNVEDVAARAEQMLNRHGIEQADILISGNNGDTEDDKLFDGFAGKMNMENFVLKYKHLCGEYATAAGFALWMAAVILKEGGIPAVFNRTLKGDKKIKSILIHNQSKNVHHSLILVSAC
jgi:3-oxoacyl-[acyl-carrier-protein] synthase II